MTADMIIVLSLVAVAVVLFVLERLSIGLVAMVVATALLVTGVLTLEEGLSGFSSRATITIAAMFMLSEGVRRTGALDRAGVVFSRLGRDDPRHALLFTMLAVGAISAFINNTAAIAIFIPVALSMARSMEISPSRLLMPISFASMFGGACTLIGTSTNILVSEIAAKQGLPAIGIFELAPVGLVFMAIGITYLLTVGRRLVPGRRDPAGASGFELNRYLTDVVVAPDSVLVGVPLGDSELVHEGLDVVNVFRDGRELSARIEQIEPRPGDVLRLHGNAAEIEQIRHRSGLSIAALPDGAGEEPVAEERVLVEVVVAPDSWLVQQKLRDARLGDRFGALPLAIRHRGSVERDRLDELRLQAGDCLLLAADVDHLDSLDEDPSIAVVDRIARERFRRGRMPLALLIVAGVVAATALGLAPVVVNAMVGVVLMMLTGCLRLEEGLKAVHWEVILLLAGMIPLGLALEKTGAAALIARSLSGWLGGWGPHAVLSGLFLFTILLTSILNNQAAAVLLSPMVIEMAHSLGADPRPFLIAVTYGASLSFITPVGYQTNTMVYGPGQYRFSDFFRVGSGLNLLLWLAGSLLIPIAWPLGG